jgi:hypothetical protein
VAGNERRTDMRQFALDDMQIRSADPTGADAEKHLTRTWSGLRDIDQFERTLRDAPRLSEYCGVHGSMLAPMPAART